MKLNMKTSEKVLLSHDHKDGRFTIILKDNTIFILAEPPLTKNNVFFEENINDKESEV